jgi:pSer/pThr/pTyr-binding forkhead associated (FHA) protein
MPGPQRDTIWLNPGDNYSAGDAEIGDLNDQLLRADHWTDAMVESAGIPIVDTSLVLVGGGIGSFVTADYLRISGVPAHEMRVLTTLDYPWQTYEYLTRVSQIPAGERLRSDSSSRPDNIWGFPSYAVSEAFAARSVRGFIAPLFQVLVEPIFTDYYTPRAGQVFAALRRESERIGYSDMVVRGQVRMVRRRADGGYLSILTPTSGTSSTKRVAYRSRFVHVAVGYPGLKFLPDLQRYREDHGDYSRVVNAYEPHEHVYEHLRRQPSTVVVRGGGIVASRVLQRLMDDRAAHGAQTTIIHLFRTFVGSSHGPSVFMRRRGGDGWAYQGFNYPKSVWGGQLKQRMRNLEGEDRAKLYKTIGGTNTPKRKLWQHQMAQGRCEGWYRTYAGEVDKLAPGAQDQVVTRITTAEGVIEIAADYVIDGTGLEADISEHRLLEDLLTRGGAQRNPLGCLDVERTFEVRGTRSGDGVIYASGAATLGGYFPGVDTFLGLQIAAQEIADDLAARGFCRRIGPMRSVAQWVKWARNVKV